MKEEFKPINNFEKYYLISNIGNVFSLGNNKFRKKKYLKLGKDKYGYLYCILYKNGRRYIKKVHRLVAIAFIPNHQNKPQVNHKDGNPSNNNINNLEWVTASENIKHSYEKLNRINGMKNKKYDKHWRSKIIGQFTIDHILLKKFLNATEIEESLKYNRKYIQQCCRGECITAYGYRWEYL